MNQVELKICRSCLNCESTKLIEPDEEVLKNFNFLLSSNNEVNDFYARMFSTTKFSNFFYSSKLIHRRRVFCLKRFVKNA